MEEVRTARILIVEDERAISEALRYGLEREGFRCSVAIDGVTALSRYRSDRPDLIVLDLMLPGLRGEEICRTIRQIDSTPIVILSAKSSEVDRILGLELGADDYVTKPFSMRELVARIRTVLRRAGSTETSEPRSRVSVGPLELDTERHEVAIHGRALTLPPREFDLLATLMRRVGKLCTREMLIGDIWGADYFGDTRTLDVHIKRLRAKIEADPRRPAMLKTVRGLGYKLEVGG